MKADRVTGNVKGTYKGKDLFQPHQFVTEANTSPNVTAYELNNDADGPAPFRSEWKDRLSNYIGEMPGGYTKDSFFFEMENGVVTRRKIASSPDSEAHTTVLVPNPELARRALLVDLFGTEDITDLSLDRLTLPPSEPRPVTAKKIDSIMGLFHLIPREHLGYYPCHDGENLDVDRRLADNEVTQRRCALAAPGTRGPGRPRKQPQPQPQSIMRFFPALREPEPEPSPWREAKCPRTGRAHYCHKITRVTRWDKPEE